MLQSGKILGGLAILEDAYHNTGKIDAVPVEKMEAARDRESALVKSWMAKIPVDLDVLILDEIGKNISGAGMDTKVVNRGVNGEYNPWPGYAAFRAHFRARPERTHLQQRRRPGHGGRRDRPAGEPHRLGADADQFADREYPGGDPHADPFPHRPRMPGSDSRQRWVNSILSQVTYAWIRNSMELTRIGLSENLRAQVESNPNLEIEASVDFDFDGNGNLLSPFAPIEETVGAH